MDMLHEFLLEEALILIPALLILGKIVKQTKVLKNKYIPLVLLVVGVGLSVALIGLSIDAFVQGVLVTGATVFGHQLYKQSKEID